MFVLQPIPKPKHEEVPTKVSPVNEMLALKVMVNEISKSKQKMFNLNDLCSTYGVKRRGFYDFLSIGSVFKICQRHTNDNFEWFGFKNTASELECIRHQVSSNPNICLKNFFDCSLNSSLQNIALSVVKLFYYLNQKTLDLRMVAKLFAQGPTKYKTMLRKLYTVAAGLELSEIVGKTNRVAEIQFLYPLQEKKLNPMDIMTMLNSKEDQALEGIFQKRREEFNTLTCDRRYLAGGIIIEPHLIPLVY